jgi:ammonia channel protein AmtB
MLQWFTLTCIAVALIPLGQFLWSLRFDSLRALLPRFVVAIAVSLIAFGALGAAIVQGDAEQLFGLARERLLFGGIDSSTLHYAMLMTIVAGFCAASLRNVGLFGLALLSLILGGAAIPAAMKWVWFGPMMRAGVIDIGGAAPLHIVGGAAAVAMARMTAELSRDRGAARFKLAPTGLLLIVFGWRAYARTAGAMQSPATAGLGAFNALRAAAAAAVVAVIIARLNPDEAGYRTVAMSLIMAMAAVSAVGGRAPGGAALFIGAFSAFIAPTVRRFFERFVGARDDCGFIIAHFAGGAIALAAAAPFGSSSMPRLQHWAVQGMTLFLASAVGMFIGLSLGLIVAAASVRRLLRSNLEKS